MAQKKADRIVTFCSGKHCCPVVRFTEKDVQIGEKGNLCILKKEDWESLKKKILDGQL